MTKYNQPQQPQDTSPPKDNLSVRGMIDLNQVSSVEIKKFVTSEEWQARVDLAACYRLVNKFGMTDMIYNHISVRVPGEDGTFLINPYGFHYSEITASMLHKVDHQGRIVLRAKTHYGINHAGFIIHSAIHAARSDLNCVIHTHTRAGVAVAAMECGLLPISLHAMRFCERLSYHECEGTIVDTAEQAALIRDLGSNDVMILRNHGLLAAGESIPEAFNAIYALEQACKTQVDVAGTEIHTPSLDAQRITSRLFEKESRRRYGVMEWEAMLRLLDREDASYRE